MSSEELQEVTGGEDTIDLTEMDDADLDKIAQGEDSGTDDVVGEGGPSEVSGEDAKPTEKEGEQATKDSAAPEEDKPTDTVDERIAKLEKQLGDKQMFIDKQAEEIGSLRIRMRGEIEREEQAIKDMYDEDPGKATQMMLDLEKKKDQEVEYFAKEVELNNKKAVHQFVPDFEDRIDEVCQVMKEDGLEEQFINGFRAQPYFDDPALIIQFVKRVDAQKRAEGYAAKVEQLERKIAELEKRPAEVVKKIADAAKRGKTITAGSGQSSANKTEVSESQLHLLSDEELDAFIKERTEVAEE